MLINLLLDFHLVEFTWNQHFQNFQLTISLLFSRYRRQNVFFLPLTISIIFKQSLSKCTLLYPLPQQFCIEIIKSWNSLSSAFLALFLEAWSAPLYSPLLSHITHPAVLIWFRWWKDPLMLHLIEPSCVLCQAHLALTCCVRDEESIDVFLCTAFWFSHSLASLSLPVK